MGALSGSREPDPRFTGSGPSGFDPERVVWDMAVRLFEHVYTTHEGSEPEAFAAALAATAPLVPAVRESIGGPIGG